MGFFKFLVLFVFCTFVAVNCHPPVQRKSRKLRIDQYRLDSSSNIPLIIIRCIQEVENRGMNNINLYHGILMNENEKNLFRELKLSNNVDLSQYSPLTFPKIIKHFFKDLQSTLIVYYVSKELSQAVESTVHFKKLKELINELPLVNRKTLALLMIHLKRLVLKNKNSALQSEINLYYRSAIFSQHTPADNQRKIFDAFFSLPFEYWNSITKYASFITIRQGENSAINAEDDMRNEVNNVLSSEDVSMQQNSDEMQPEMRFISNYALDSSFSIPLIVKRCIQEVENRGMNEPLLYFEISYEENGKKLFTELTNNHVDLSQQNPLIIAETLKFFLRFLKSPLIVPELINEFSQAVESTVDFEKLKELINKLPLVNRRTLALLMTHLKRVLKQNHVSRMQLNIIFKHLFFHCYASPNIAGIILDAFFSFPFKYWNLITNYTSIIKIRQEENSAINTEDDMRNEVIHVLSSDEDDTMQETSDERQPQA
ncbi:uncharacterized protein LOC127286594 isoform X2 [Leptopilina boulardi]|nr:uncharacterized protein LOC127286594 isoform X2 [Leptopilina boulardi]